MKNAIKLLTISLILIIAASCGKTPYELLKKDHSVWTATSVTTITGFDPITNVYSYTFYEGSATSVDTGGHQSGFNWAYDKKSQKIILTSVAGNDVYNFVYNVSDISKDSEKWTFASQDLNGLVIPTPDYSQVITLKKN